MNSLQLGDKLVYEESNPSKILRFMISDTFRQRLLAAAWFAASALLCVGIMFHTVTMAPRAAFLYGLLPTVAGGIAGGLAGGSLLNRAKTSTVGQSLLRGIAVAAAAFVIFSLLFAFALPFTERGWSLRQSGGLLLLTWTLGALFAAPMVFLGGLLAGVTLYLFGKVIGG